MLPVQQRTKEAVGTRVFKHEYSSIYRLFETAPWKQRMDGLREPHIADHIQLLCAHCAHVACLLAQRAQHVVLAARPGHAVHAYAHRAGMLRAVPQPHMHAVRADARGEEYRKRQQAATRGELCLLLLQTCPACCP